MLLSFCWANLNILIPSLFWIGLSNRNWAWLLKKLLPLYIWRSSLSQLALMVTVSQFIPIFDRYYRGFSLGIKTGLKSSSFSSNHFLLWRLHFRAVRDTFSMKTFKKTPSHFQVASHFTSKRLKDAKGVFRSVHRGLVHHARALCKISIYGKSQSWV